MNNPLTNTPQLIASSYKEYQGSLYRYFYSKIKNREEAEDLTQELFLRVLETEMLLRSETIKYYLFKIAQNLLIDYWRRHNKRQEVNSYIYDATPTLTNQTEMTVIVNDLYQCEQHRLNTLPDQRKKVYIMSRYNEMSVMDISKEMNLSLRTVENHLCISRKEVREYMRRCI